MPLDWLFRKAEDVRDAYSELKDDITDAYCDLIGIEDAEGKKKYKEAKRETPRLPHGPIF